MALAIFRIFLSFFWFASDHVNTLVSYYLFIDFYHYTEFKASECGLSFGKVFS